MGTHWRVIWIVWAQLQISLHKEAVLNIDKNVYSVQVTLTGTYIDVANGSPEQSTSWYKKYKHPEH